MHGLQSDFLTPEERYGPASALWIVWLAAGLVVGSGLLIAGIAHWQAEFFGERRGAVARARGFVDVPAKELRRLGLRVLPLVADQEDGRFSHGFRHQVGDARVYLFQFRRGDDPRDEQTVVAFDLGATVLPHRFAISPERLLERLLGEDDLDFADHPVFSRRYRLRGVDEPGIRRLFGEQALSFFEREPPGWHVEGGGRWLLVYRKGETVEAQKLDAFLDDATRVVTALTNR